jgi:hypothetical protein
VSKELLSQRTADYQKWVNAFARNHDVPIQWAEKGVRKEDFVRPWLRRMVKKNAYGVYFNFKSVEQGPSFRITGAEVSDQGDPNHRILARQKSLWGAKNRSGTSVRPADRRDGGLRAKVLR